MTRNTYNVLFLCIGNPAPSIVAKGLVATMGRDAIRGVMQKIGESKL